jgi:hypothetical protein
MQPDATFRCIKLAARDALGYAEKVDLVAA